jgi:hypothetical protein
LFADAEPIERAFLGEPVREVLALVEWALAREVDPGFEKEDTGLDRGSSGRSKPVSFSRPVE